ncbi:NAD(+) diphosphatase [Actinokineospora globicatena]|uniref:NAD(+) diphosphatase n=1 Tax=Actinokineospora globicatena TaxID=103729 RepID=UPI0020A2EA29|nr:NAD(+) diphosphatase [Actinokineospora globicatena]MCP2304911.1 NAD+ diphosphatase [Actinokineospora globicatena]GLW77708.1 NADH pyrophosphatase [Actinokineospora globicatena]GLW85623.1 NADH pyrophosphatase [Actinokineospora globicatena]
MENSVPNPPVGVLPYSGMALDRAGARRTDAAWLDTLRPHGHALAFWRDRCLVRDGRPVRTAATDDAVFLGLDGDTGLFARDLSEMDEEAALAAAGADTAADIRGLFADLGPEDATRLAYARGLLHWRRNQRFCGACGSAAVDSHAGHVRKCSGCGKLLFPRIEPAVIVLVEHEDRCLLGRHRGARGFSTLAGFVEIGESLEDAVRREVAEESGVAVGAVEYLASQAWPFPSGLMLGFRAEAVSPDIAVDRDELEEARWFTRAEVAALGDRRPDSVESFLVDRWLVGPQH